MSLGTRAHHHCRHHSERSPLTQDPCANKCTDTKTRQAAAAAKPPDSAPGAHSASKGRKGRHSPGPHSKEFPASANLQSWREQIPLASVADPDLHSAKSKFPDSRSPVAQRSRRSAHGQHATAPSATGPGVRDNVRENQQRENQKRDEARRRSQIAHKNILAGSASALGQACCLPHRVSGGPHGLAPGSAISRFASMVARLAARLPYHFRLRQPQRR